MKVAEIKAKGGKVYEALTSTMQNAVKAACNAGEKLIGAYGKVSTDALAILQASTTHAEYRNARAIVRAVFPKEGETAKAYSAFAYAFSRIDAGVKGYVLTSFGKDAKVSDSEVWAKVVAAASAEGMTVNMWATTHEVVAKRAPKQVTPPAEPVEVETGADIVPEIANASDTLEALREELLAKVSASFARLNGAALAFDPKLSDETVDAMLALAREDAKLSLERAVSVARQQEGAA